MHQATTSNKKHPFEQPFPPPKKTMTDVFSTADTILSHEEHCRLRHQKQEETLREIEEVEAIWVRLEEDIARLSQYENQQDNIKKKQANLREVINLWEFKFENYDHENDVLVPQHYKNLLRGLNSCRQPNTLTRLETEELEQYLRKNLNCINYCDSQGHTILFTAVRFNFVPIIKLLLANNVNLNHQYYLTKYSILQYALRRLSFEDFKFLVENANIDAINQQDAKGYTLLMSMVDQCYDDTPNMFCEHIKLILKHGANPNLKNNKNETAAHICIKQNNWKYLSLLAEQNENSPSNVPRSVLDFGLQTAINNYDRKSIKILVEKYGATTFFETMPKGVYQVYIHLNAKCLANSNRKFINFLFTHKVLQHPLLNITFEIESYRALINTKFYRTLIKNGFCEDVFDINVPQMWAKEDETDEGKDVYHVTFTRKPKYILVRTDMTHQKFTTNSTTISKSQYSS